MATRKSIAQATEKYQRRVSQAGQDYKTGVEAATGWAAGATAAKERRDAGLRQAMADGRIDAGINRVGDSGWKNATVTKGVQNWQTAVASAGSKFSAGLQKAYGDLAAADAATASMDTTTLEARVAKAAAYQLAVARSAAQRKASGG